ncbi:MAG: hypothetical protein RJA36_2926 [Pseudomonadota bacterium]|jgi:hypothetical protein
MKQKTQLLAVAGALILAAGFAASTAQAGQCLPQGANCGKPAGLVKPVSQQQDQDEQQSGTDAIVDIRSIAQGQSYGHWAADWWKWAVSIPAANNPLLDSTGQYCGERQTGNVWFLAGYAGSGTVSRTCTVPAGKSLFFPIINNFYAAWLNDPPDTRTDDYVRNAAVNGCTNYQITKVEIDDMKVINPMRYNTGKTGSQSPMFTAQLPPDNLFGLTTDVAPELAFSPSAEYGYYLFLKPLKRGQRTIKWSASSSCGTQDITYHLTIQ